VNLLVMPTSCALADLAVLLRSMDSVPSTWR